MSTPAEHDPDVLVVGAGVIGLTTGICLAEAGLNVEIAAAEAPQQTTSAAAGALWGPHLVGHDDRIARWAAVTLDRLAELTSPGLGANALDGIVRPATGMAAGQPGDDGPPEVTTGGGTASECAPGDVPSGYHTGWRFTAPLIAMPGYLDYLHERFLRAGGTTTFPATFATLGDASRHAAPARVVVNCTGCGARDFAADLTVTPVRGQIVVVSNPGLTEFFVGTGADGWDLAYVFPHGDVVVLGGTEEAGDWSREPDLATAERIIAACAVAEPALRDATVLAHRVGLRPSRPLVRLEAEQRGDVTVVHNYGHGGAGVTLSWGCAEDAARLALAALG